MFRVDFYIFMKDKCDSQWQHGRFITCGLTLSVKVAYPFCFIIFHASRLFDMTRVGILTAFHKCQIHWRISQPPSVFHSCTKTEK